MNTMSCLYYLLDFTYTQVYHNQQFKKEVTGIMKLAELLNERKAV